ncbi:hypothetical protein BW36_02231 [Micrococcus luteus]|nr:hypothetical protein BW36_02231 [Micrococcus luteus]
MARAAAEFAHERAFGHLVVREPAPTSEPSRISTTSPTGTVAFWAAQRRPGWTMPTTERPTAMENAAQSGRSARMAARATCPFVTTWCCSCGAARDRAAEHLVRLRGTALAMCVATLSEDPVATAAYPVVTRRAGGRPAGARCGRPRGGSRPGCPRCSERRGPRRSGRGTGRAWVRPRCRRRGPRAGDVRALGGVLDDRLDAERPRLGEHGWHLPEAAALVVAHPEGGHALLRRARADGCYDSLSSVPSLTRRPLRPRGVPNTTMDATTNTMRERESPRNQ